MTEPDERFSETLCIKCGYNLRGLPANGSCPECGLSICISMQRGQLRYSSPMHLATLHHAILFLLGGTALFLVLEVAWKVMGFSNIWTQVLATIPTLIGLWGLTTP